MALWVKAFATKPFELNWTPWTHLLEGENSLKLFSDLHVYTVTHMYTNTKIDVM